jgi:hypothetical protein
MPSDHFTIMDKFLEDIRVAENAWSIKTTRDYAGLRKITPTKPISLTIFKPGIVLKLAVVFFLAIPVIVISALVRQKTVTGNEIAGLVVGFGCLAIIIPQVVRQAFFDKKRNFIIKIDATGISIDDAIYPWDTVYETAIMIKTAGSSRYKYLVIAMDNQSTYEPYDLSSFVSLNPFGFAVTLSKYIEYFRPEPKASVQR